MFTFSTTTIVIGIISGILMGIPSGIFSTLGSVATSNVIGEEDYNTEELIETVTFHNDN